MLARLASYLQGGSVTERVSSSCFSGGPLVALQFVVKVLVCPWPDCVLYGVAVSCA